MSDQIAVYPGSFDPITRGHEDIVWRALRLADRVVVAVAHRATQSKRGLFDIAERVAMIEEVFRDEPRVEATEFEGLLVDFADRRGARLIVRGLRAVSDFEYEFQMALMNRRLRSGIETVFFAPDVDYSFVSASLVREVASMGGDVGDFVSEPVARRLRERFGSAG